MLGVQTYYARATSPAHLLYPLRLASSHFQTIPDIKPFYNNSRKQEKDSDRFGSVTGEEDRKVTYDTGELRLPPQLRGWEEGES